MKTIVWTIFIISLGQTLAFGQVLSIDREIETDSTFKRMRYAGSFNFSNDKQRRTLIDFAGTNEVDVFLKNKHLFVFLAKNDLALNGSAVNENNGFFQLRFRDNDSRKISPDIFTQYQWNGIQGIEYRYLIGANMRMMFLEEKESDLYNSIGVFYETEKWNPTLRAFTFPVADNRIVYRNLFRLNLSSKFAIKFSDNIDWSGITFVQFPLNNKFLSPRWFFDGNLTFSVNKHLGIVIHYDHNLDWYRPLPIDVFYYSIQTGLNLVF